MKRRGFTLIELMIVIAVIGIVSAASGLTGVELRVRARAAVEREQALLALEHQAARLSAGEAPDPAVSARLAEPLRDVVITTAAQGPATTITVAWRDPSGRPVHRALTVFTPGGRR